jgi:hypothetical protein
MLKRIYPYVVDTNSSAVNTLDELLVIGISFAQLSNSFDVLTNALLKDCRFILNIGRLGLLKT